MGLLARQARSAWHPLQCKPGQKKSGYRGELELKVDFKVLPTEQAGGSAADLSKKKKGSSSSLARYEAWTEINLCDHLLVHYVQDPG